MQTLAELAQIAGGRVRGDAEAVISGVQPFDEAGPEDITLAQSVGYLSRLTETNAGAVIVPCDFESEIRPLLQSENPKLAFARVLAHLRREPFRAQGVSSLASIGSGCHIDHEVTIEPFVRVGDGVVIGPGCTLRSGVSVGDGCRIGNDCSLHPNVVLYPRSQLGRRVAIHAGSVIGADGFGYVFDGEQHFKMEQTGIVEIGDDVEIGANSCVDRATFGATVIGRGVKIDNHVHIGHNCRVGEHTVIVGCVGISGSVSIGRNCVLAGQAGVIDHINIGDNVTVMVKTAVTKDIPSGMTVSGQPGRNHGDELKIRAVLRRLPEMYKDWRTIKRRFGIED